jgi:predicted transcriptional regulator
MAALNLRLEDELDARLAREAQRADQTRSELARQAIAQFLAQRDRQRFLDRIARAARARGYREALTLAGEALATDNEALDLAERVVAEPKASYRVKRKRR